MFVVALAFLFGEVSLTWWVLWIYGFPFVPALILAIAFVALTHFPCGYLGASFLDVIPKRVWNVPYMSKEHRKEWIYTGWFALLFGIAVLGLAVGWYIRLGLLALFNAIKNSLRFRV